LVYFSDEKISGEENRNIIFPKEYLI